MRILLVHDSLSVQKILQHYFATEMTDSYVRAADSSEAMAYLGAQKFDIIMSGVEMRRSNAGAIREALPGTPNWDTPFIAMSSNGSPEQRARLAAHGIHHHLLIPFNPMEMSAILRSIHNPRSRRAHLRFALPGTEVVIDLDEHEVTAAVINISVAGVLCDMPLPRHADDLFRTPLLTVTFPKEFNHAKAAGIRSGMLRLQAIGWTSTRHTSQVRTAWSFLDMPAASQEVLQRVLAQAQHNLENAEAELKKA